MRLAGTPQKTEVGSQTATKAARIVGNGIVSLGSILVILGKTTARPTTYKNQAVVRTAVVEVRMELDH
jgi:hypothetical protein